MKFASVELKTRGRLGRKPQLDLVIFKSGEGFFFDFLTASHSSLKVLGIAFLRSRKYPFSQFLLYFVMFLFLFDTSVDMFKMDQVSTPWCRRRVLAL